MRRMKAVATFMFALALVGALIAWPYRESFTGGLLFAAFEAALVGALADWFAVVALFRHPLGLKFIPHTAIIPNNRSRIIEGIVAIVEKDWLSLDFIRAKVFDYPLIDGLDSVLETEDGRRGLERLVESLVTNTLQELDPEDAAHFLQLLLKDNLEEIRISSHLIEQLEASVKTLYADDLIRILLNWAVGATRGDEFDRVIKRTLTRAAADYSNQGNFFRRLGKGLSESLDIVNYEEAAKALSHRINRFLIEMQDPGNQYHIKVKKEMQKVEIADSDAAAEMLSDMLKNMVESEAGFKAATEVFSVFKAQFLSGNNQDMPMSRYLTNMVIEQITMIRRDEDRKSNLESRIKTELSNLLEHYHGVIGQIVREKLESLDDSGLVMSLEDKVGDDLQWIRINGTVIGALVGILQYLIVHLI
ncbi:MAG TPA: DUF445 domain-containing protein [Syntrophomonadaceae bacterium]|nr:DUF445 domain-containing protein [Syntrophomonadaceae bacterium]